MTEMRRPHDFIRGMALAQALIIVCYLMYGIYVYAMQGQFTLALAYQGVSKYAWQTVGNVLALITGAIAAALYGNIGLKVLYINIVEGIFKGPPLMSKKGRLGETGVPTSSLIGLAEPPRALDSVGRLGHLFLGRSFRHWIVRTGPFLYASQRRKLTSFSAAVSPPSEPSQASSRPSVSSSSPTPSRRSSCWRSRCTRTR